MKTQRIVFHVDKKMYESLRQESERTGAPQAEILRRALAQYLERKQK